MSDNTASFAGFLVKREKAMGIRRTGSRSRKGKHTGASAQIERLEFRRLLSASLDATSGLLTVIGTNHADQIALTQAGATLTVNVDGSVSTFDATQVQQISVQGLAGNDLITVAQSVTAPATLDGSAGNNTTIRGGGGPESIVGGHGIDSLVAGSGDDTIDGSNGAKDTIRGGAGTDILIGGNGNDWIGAGSGSNNVLIGGNGNDTLRGGLGGGDFLDDGNGNDSLIGGLGNETLSAGSGNDTLRGGDGDQTLMGQGGNDLIYGGKGSDLLESTVGNSTIYGGTGQDTLQATDGNVLFYAGLGDDVMHGSTGSCRFVGGPGNDTMFGGNSTGSDTFIAGTGNDVMNGGLGDNVFLDGPGNNVMNGGPSSDTFYNNGTGHDTIDGGPRGLGLNSAEQNPNDVITNIDFFFATVPPVPGPVPAAQHAVTASASLLPATSTLTPYQMALQFAATVPIRSSPAASVSNGMLIVTGTNNTDTINLRQTGSTISVVVNNLSLGSFNAGSLTNGVFVNPGGGNDNVSLEDGSGANAVSVIAYLLTGTGADSIRGGAGTNFFDMGTAKTGNKTLIGTGVNNVFDFSKRIHNVRVALDGSQSGEYQFGENDAIICHNNAAIYGGAGNNTLYATFSADVQIFGGGGSATIFGATGPFSTFVGGAAGNNTIFGGTGIDTIYVRNNKKDFYSKGSNRNSVIVGDTNLDFDMDTKKNYPY